MPRDNSTNPWGDATNQAVGAMYKYYMSQPTAADRIKMQLQEAQLAELQSKTPLELQKLQLDNQMNQRMYDAGAYPGMPASAQEFEYDSRLPSEGSRDFRNLFLTKPTKFDVGDKQFMMGATGPMPGTEIQVGAPPRVEVNKEGREYLPVPAIPSQPMGGAAGLFNQYTGMDLIDGPMQPVVEDVGLSSGGMEKLLADILGGATAQPPAPIINQAPQQPMMGPIPFDTAKSPADTAKQDTARAGVTDGINTMAKAYLDLRDQGGAVSSDQKWLTQNLPNYIASTGIGQIGGRALGTDEQRLRDLIATQKPALMGAVRQASDMGVKGMDSEKELQFYLNALGDPSMDVRTSLAALEVLNNNLGLGATRFANPDEVQRIRQQAKEWATKANTAPQPVATSAPDFDNMSEEELDRFIAEQNGR